MNPKLKNKIRKPKKKQPNKKKKKITNSKVKENLVQSMNFRKDIIKNT